MSAITIIDSPVLTRQYTLTTISNREYLIIDRDIYEIQSTAPNNGKYASYMIGSRFISNPDLFVVSRVDPLFFVLDYLESVSSNNADDGGGGKWQPFDQLFKDISPHVLTALNMNLSVSTIQEMGQLAHLLDASDVFGDDIVCKFNDDKAMTWLNAKYQRSLLVLRARKLDKKRRLAERKASGEYGAFSSSFVLDEGKKEKTEKNGNNGVEMSLNEEENRAVQVSALQLLSEYLPTSWRAKLAKSLNLTEQETKKSTPTTSGEKRPRSKWEGAIGQTDADDLLCLATGQSKEGMANSVTPVENSVKNAQSVGLKRLAKVNTKGMKSLTSFFGGKKKKT
eukprot:scaffold127606_cov73-Cyclotella_meneghiniana.AAC.2